MIIVAMDALRALEILVMLLLTVLTWRGLWHAARRKPFVSVSNARALVFSGGMLAGTLYFWVSLLKALLL